MKCSDEESSLKALSCPRMLSKITDYNFCSVNITGELSPGLSQEYKKLERGNFL